jgi:uncharacterized damage-inducible protein DinB
MFSPEQAKGLCAFLMQNANAQFEITKKVLAAIPADQLNFKLGDKGRTTSELAWHIVTSDIWFLDGVADLSFSMEEGGPPAPATVAEMLAFYTENFARGVERVNAMTGEQLTTPVDFFGMMQLPAVTYLSFLSNHQIHHRGQLSTYLRAMNAHVPSIYGPSADESLQSSATA